MLAPPGESHDTWEQADIGSDAFDIIQGTEGNPDNNWLGLPLETHKLHKSAIQLALDSAHSVSAGSGNAHVHSTGIDAFFGGGLTACPSDYFGIQWIRIYKNPKTTKLGAPELQQVGTYHKGGTDTNYVVTPPGFEKRRARLFPSFWTEYEELLDGTTQLANEADTYFWVNIDPGGGPSDPTSGGLLEDPNKPGNSGLVTDSENTWVVPGDIVAIAINVKLTYYEVVTEFIDPAPGLDPRSDYIDPDKEEPLLLPALFSNTTFTRGPGFYADRRQAPWSRSTGGSVARDVAWTENELPLWFKDGQKGNPAGTIWARNFFRDANGGTVIAAVGIDGVGRLNPNYPLERITQDGRVNHIDADHAVTATEWGHPGVDGYHTVVYQFTVTKEHADALNRLKEDDGWLEGDGDNIVAPFNVPYRPAVGVNYEYGQLAYLTAYPYGYTYDVLQGLHAAEFGFGVPFGDNSDTGQQGKRWAEFMDASALFKAGETFFPYPEGTGAKRGEYRHHRVLQAGVYTKGGNLVFTPEHFDRNSDGFLDYLPIIDNTVGNANSGGRVQHYTVSAGFYRDSRLTFPHYFPPTYDTATSPEGPIAYPAVVKDPVAAMTVIDELSGTQTGPFTLTLRFQEDYSPLGHGQSAAAHDLANEKLFTALQTALSADVGDSTVTVNRPEAADAWLRYPVRVVPPLGFKGALTFQVPEDTVFAHLDPVGNLGSNSVTVQVDTVLEELEVGAPSIVAPEADVYNAGDKLTVEVPFATTGLTYEGENPPYVRIYLGEEIAANARDAIWQQGEERSGSTIVPFVYVLQASDVAILQALDPDDQTVHPDVSRLGVPEGTRVVASEAGLAHLGENRLAVDAGVVAPPLVGGLPGQDASGSEPGPVTLDVPVPSKPQVIYLPPDDTVSKAVASAVPLSPVVFNELGNGSDATNDWLEFRNVTGSDVSLKDWELSVVADGKKEDTSLIVFPDVSVPANGLLLITNMPSDKTPLAGGENRGLSHASLVDAGLSLPDDGKFLLILRNAKEKLGLDEAFIDVAGGGGSDTDAFIRDETGDYDTHVWPLQVLESPGDATEDALSSGKVWQRAKADLIGYHRDAWAEAAFTGIGYDRQVSKSAATAGTPGYPNGAVKTEASTPKGAVTISEIMFDSEGGTLPQWIELYNKSKTEALNLNRWQLEIQNRNSGDLVGRPIVTLTLQEKVIQPNQTLLIVAGDARASSADVFPEDRVYNLLKLHEKNLRIKTARDTFLSGEGFYLKLSDRNGTKIDEVGNIDDNRRTDDAPVWVWPTNRRDGARSSVVRRYDKGAVARDGMLKSNWALAAHFNKFKVESLHYGHAEDIGTPGYRQGGALPVELSSFTLTRTDAGPVIVTWTTESEVDNAGFNLRRSLKRDSGFTLLNPVLIAGAGTTGERQTYTFTDTSAKPGVEYYYQIEEVSLGGRPETLRTRYLPGPVSPANRSLTTFGEVKQRE